MDKLISLLIPSRRRPDALLGAIDSFLSTAEDASRVEVLVRLDDDDTDSLALTLPDNTICLQGPRPQNGYGGLHLLYNELYSKASGQYIWVLNDDIRNTTAEWDARIAELDNLPCIAAPRHSIIPGGNLFPIIHRKIIEVQTFFALYASVDIQYENVVNEISSLKRDMKDIHIQHLNNARQHDIDGLGIVNVLGSHETDVMFQEGIRRLKLFFN